jgi:hypothetical protein
VPPAFDRARLRRATWRDATARAPLLAGLLVLGGLAIAWRMHATRTASSVTLGVGVGVGGIAADTAGVDGAIGGLGALGAVDMADRTGTNRTVDMTPPAAMLSAGRSVGALAAGDSGAVSSHGEGAGSGDSALGRPARGAASSIVTATTSTGAPVATQPPCGARIPGAIPAESAADFLDTHQAVEFLVVGTKDTGKVTFLNAHEPYQGHFYVAIFPSDYDLYPAPPAQYFKGRCIVVQGRIERYRGAPQIVLRGPEDVRVVEGVQALDDGRDAESYTETTAPSREIP